MGVLPEPEELGGTLLFHERLPAALYSLLEVAHPSAGDLVHLVEKDHPVGIFSTRPGRKRLVSRSPLAT